MVPLALLDRYIVRRLVMYTIALLVLIVTVLQMLDLLSLADDIMAAPGANGFSLLRYAILRAPEFVVRFTPFALLIAVLLNLSQLAGTSEIIAMRAAGMSPSLILRPLLIGAAIIALTHFAFQEWVAANTSSRLQVWQELDYSNLDTVADQENRDIWISSDGLIVGAKTAYRFGQNTKISDLDIYQIGKDGLLLGVILSKNAISGEPSWILKETLRCTSDENSWVKSDQIGWTTPLTTQDFFPNAQPQSVHQLRKEAKKRRLRNEPSAKLNTSLLSHFSRPLSDMVMPLIGLFVGFSLPRNGTFAWPLLIGLGAGFLFFTLDSLFIAIGNSGALPAYAAAFGAPLLFTLSGTYALIGLER
ncbi:MAG: hypothetical protein COA84_07210 [Robiginitomaculum sp.]|nr:MAG: hypothetical protein COA84_07210 [Robiginitomaculum sp.]